MIRFSTSMIYSNYHRLLCRRLEKPRIRMFQFSKIAALTILYYLYPSDPQKPKTREKGRHKFRTWEGKMQTSNHKVDLAINHLICLENAILTTVVLKRWVSFHSVNKANILFGYLFIHLSLVIPCQWLERHN